MKQKTFDEYMKERFGGKVYKLCLSTGCSCPGRDRGFPCIFCSAGGSGDFAAPASLSIDDQLLFAKEKVAGKLSAGFAGYMAYFQSFTNTYGPVEKLRPLFLSAADAPDVLCVSIATRPDCLSDEMVEMLGEINAGKPLFVELGFQTAKESTARFIRRGYPNPVFEDALRRLHEKNIETIAHLIIGLPGENEEDWVQTASYISRLADDGLINGVKLQILQVLKGTELARLYEKDPSLVPDISLEQYAAIIKNILRILPEDIVIHRITGDPPKSLIISPLWTTDKKKVLNYLRAAI